MDRSGGIGRKGGHKWRYKGGKVDVGGGIYKGDKVDTSGGKRQTEGGIYRESNRGMK